MSAQSLQAAQPTPAPAGTGSSLLTDEQVSSIGSLGRRMSQNIEDRRNQFSYEHNHAPAFFDEEASLEGALREKVVKHQERKSPLNQTKGGPFTTGGDPKLVRRRQPKDYEGM